MGERVNAYVGEDVVTVDLLPHHDIPDRIHIRQDSGPGTYYQSYYEPEVIANSLARKLAGARNMAHILAALCVVLGAVILVQAVILMGG